MPKSMMQIKKEKEKTMGTQMPAPRENNGHLDACQ
jgi:hypothetical protein